MKRQSRILPQILIIIPGLAIVLGLNQVPAAMALNLNQQLDIPLNNGSRSAGRVDADRLVQQGVQQQRAGSLAQAIGLWQTALPLYRQWGDGVAEGQTYERIGKAYEKMGQYQAAEDALRRYLALARANQDVQAQIFGFNNVGRCLLRQGHLTEAEQSFQQGLKLAQDLRFPQGEGLSWSNLGLVSYKLGRYAEALQRYQVAKSLHRYADADPIAEAESQNDMGNAFLAVNNSGEAAIAYRQALFLANEGRDRPNQFRAMTGLVTAYESQRQLGNASDILNQRLALAIEEKNSRETIKSLQLLAQFYHHRGDMVAADSYFQQALTLAKAVNAEPEIAALNNQLTTLRVINQNRLK